MRPSTESTEISSRVYWGTILGTVKFHHTVKFRNSGIVSESDRLWQSSGQISVDQWRNLTMSLLYVFTVTQERAQLG